MESVDSEVEVAFILCRLLTRVITESLSNLTIFGSPYQLRWHSAHWQSLLTGLRDPLQTNSAGRWAALIERRRPEQYLRRVYRAQQFGCQFSQSLLLTLAASKAHNLVVPEVRQEASAINISKVHANLIAGTHG